MSDLAIWDGRRAAHLPFYDGHTFQKMLKKYILLISTFFQYHCYISLIRVIYIPSRFWYDVVRLQEDGRSAKFKQKEWARCTRGLDATGGQLGVAQRISLKLARMPLHTSVVRIPRIRFSCKLSGSAQLLVGARTSVRMMTSGSRHPSGHQNAKTTALPISPLNFASADHRNTIKKQGRKTDHIFSNDHRLFIFQTIELLPTFATTATENTEQR